MNTLYINLVLIDSQLSIRNNRIFIFSCCWQTFPSVLWCCSLCDRKGIYPVYKNSCCNKISKGEYHFFRTVV